MLSGEGYSVQEEFGFIAESLKVNRLLPRSGYKSCLEMEAWRFHFRSMLTLLGVAPMTHSTLLVWLVTARLITRYEMGS